MMYVWNLEKFISHFQEDRKEIDIGDNVAIYYQGELQPIRINGIEHTELHYLKGSYCIYEMEECEYFSEHAVEMIAIEEYSDSPYSIYINVEGVVESYEYKNIFLIEIGPAIRLHIEKQRVISYEIITKNRVEKTV